MLVLMLTIWTVLPLYSQFRRDENGLVVRKNIDVLNQMELATFEHAIQILKDRSNVNPFDTVGFAWQAWIHNNDVVYVPKSGGSKLKRGDFPSDREYYEAVSWEFKEGPGTEEANPGNCIHYDERFLFWHRAQFYYFEKILQDTNPNGNLIDSKGKSYITKDLAIPFWDFTIKPSGVRYPKALENVNSILYHEFRATSDQPIVKYDRTAFLQLLWEEDSWREFGGGPNSGDQGAIESKFHNSMHNTYAGGNGFPVIRDNQPSMRDPNTAAYDPLFFVFHSFLEYALTKWVEVQSADKITFDKNLRGTQSEKYHLFPKERKYNSMGKSSWYLDNETLGYTYDNTISDSLDVTKKLVAIDRKSLKKMSSEWLLTKKTSLGPITQRNEVRESVISAQTLLEDQDGKLSVIIQDHMVPNRVDIYIHPVHAEVKIEKRSFRKKYFVEWATTWNHHFGHGDQDQVLTIDLKEELQEIARKVQSGNLVITTNLSVNK